MDNNGHRIEGGNMKVYILTSGEYSDYRINAVCSTKELANKFVEADKLIRERYSDNFSIEEWELNEAPPVKLYNVSMDKDGVDKGTSCDIVTLAEANRIGYRISFFRPLPGHQPEFSCNVIADTKERAIKTANDIRVRILALELWGKEKEANEAIGGSMR